jgi:glycine/D-amino acid oxidase-like deaminating enzyme
MLEKEYDFIIIGQGLAGTCLAYELNSRGKKVLVFDDPEMPSSSMVAGGLYNPVTGRNMVLTWKAYDLFPYLQKFYSRLENLLKVKLLQNMPLYRPFSTTKELNEWQGKSNDSRLLNFIDFISPEAYESEYIKNEVGGIMFKQTGYLNTQVLLQYFRDFLRENNILKEEKFIKEKLNFYVDSVVYNEYSAKKIIFCDGQEGFGNQLLNKIRFHSVKGEVLRLQMDYNCNFILNKNGFVLPRDGQFLAGSNYNLKDASWDPTIEGRQEIVDKIDKIVNIEYEIIDQLAGLRPTAHDRRPVVGLLPDKPQIGVFNGLGTKGVSLAPYFANQFADNLINGAELDREVHIGRYFN